MGDTAPGFDSTDRVGMAGHDAVVFAGGPVGPPRPVVIAADGGLHLATLHGLRPDLIIGDLDSVDSAALAAATEAGVEVARFPVDKDRTDIELALERALGGGHRRVLVVGSDGGRLDHLLGMVGVLAGDRFAALELEALLGDHRVVVVRGRRSIAAPEGALVSLLAWHGEARGVTTTGLRWPLTDAVLPAGSSWGMSNEFVLPDATVEVRSGCVVAVLPAPEERNP